MKNGRIRALLKIAGGIAAFSVVSLVGSLGYISHRDRPVFEKCLTLKLGMARDEILSVMGPPALEYETPKVSEEPDSMTLVWSVSSLQSTSPHVTIDRTSKTATEITCHD